MAHVDPLVPFADLLVGVSPARIVGFRTALVDCIVEGWKPTREDVALLVRASRGELTDAEFDAAVLALVTPPADATRATA